MRYAYTLTEKGAALGDVLSAIVRWGRKHIPGTETLTESRPHAAPGGSARASTRKKVPRDN